MRRVLFLCAVSAILAVSSAGGAIGQVEPVRYTDPMGWSLGYPPTMHLERSSARFRVSISEVTVASFAPRTAVRSESSPTSSTIRVDPPLDANGEFPDDGVAFRMLSFEGGPPPNPEVEESRFPLALAGFEASESYADTTPQPVERLVAANGRTYGAFAWIGPAAPTELREELARVVSSLAFPRLRPGTAVGSNFSVLQPSRSYPVGSFTRVRVQGRRIYLVHAPGGFYAVGWRRSSHDGGYTSRCRLALDLPRKELFCTNLRARWDRVGRVVARPPGAERGEPLFLPIAKTAWDGHVLLNIGVHRYADARLARTLWPGWRPAG